MLGVAEDYSGASCLGSGSHISSRAAYSMLGDLGSTCSDALCSVALSTIVGSFGLALGATCLLVALAPAVAGFPPTASSSGTFVDAELQFDKCTIDFAYYYLPLLLILIDVCRYLHVRLTMCG
jgi:hypothetical protein